MPSVLMSYFFKATLPLKPATIALKIGYLAFQEKFHSNHLAGFAMPFGIQSW